MLIVTTRINSHFNLLLFVLPAHFRLFGLDAGCRLVLAKIQHFLIGNQHINRHVVLRHRHRFYHLLRKCETAFRRLQFLVGEKPVVIRPPAPKPIALAVKPKTGATTISISSNGTGAPVVGFRKPGTSSEKPVSNEFICTGIICLCCQDTFGTTTVLPICQAQSIASDVSSSCGSDRYIITVEAF